MTYYDYILLGAALIGVAGNLIQIVDRFWPKNKDIEKVKNGKVSKMRTIITGLAILATVVSLAGILYAISGAFRNEQLTREAWRYLEAKDYNATIEKAEECVTLFHDEALVEQKSLRQNGGTPPPKGRVGKVEKEKIFKRGILNDVATCWFILGKAHAGKGDKEKAKKAFQKAMLLPDARC